MLITGPRLELRPLTPEDVTDAYVRWMNDPAVTQYLESRYRQHSLDDLRGYVAEVSRAPGTHMFAIVTRDDGRHIGNIKIGPVDQMHRRADIGIIVGEPDCWGRGYAGEAIGLLADWAFSALEVDKLTAGAYAPNVASIRAFERAGFHQEAVQRRHYVIDGTRVDGVLMARFAPSAEPTTQGSST